MRKVSISKIITLRKVIIRIVARSKKKPMPEKPAAVLARMRAAALSPERRSEIAAIASQAAIEARKKKIPAKKRSEIAKKAAEARWRKKKQ